MFYGVQRFPADGPAAALHCTLHNLVTAPPTAFRNSDKIFISGGLARIMQEVTAGRATDVELMLGKCRAGRSKLPFRRVSRDLWCSPAGRRPAALNDKLLERDLGDKPPPQDIDTQHWVEQGFSWAGGARGEPYWFPLPAH